jgi:4-amino-4-deoxy-L-arabinose transferase-like glycosyltransferase
VALNTGTNKARYLAWALVLSAIPLLGWWSYGLFDLDEGFYGAITAEMNRRGEWITPFYNGQPWFEKPILLYWAAKPCLMLFGAAIGPRLPSILATLGTYGVVGWFARRRFGEAAAAVSVLALGSCLLVVGVGRMMLTDPLLLLALTAAFLTFWESLVGDKRWRLVTAACLGAGVLAKGPIACILFVPLAAWTGFREADLRAAFRGYWLLGFALLLAVVGLWYVPAYLKDGHEFVQKFLIEQNIGRFSGGDQAHTMRGPGGWFFYVPIALLGFAPWIWLLPRSLGAGPPEDAALRRYLLAWIVIVFGFFTIASAKLPHYVLPMAPPIAILVGSDLARRWNGGLRWRTLAAPVVWLLAVAAIAQTAFTLYSKGLTIGGTSTPRFEEVQGLATFIREHAAPGDGVVEYSMSGNHSPGAGPGTRLQETSHPSTLLYLDRDALETDDWNEVLKSRAPTWVLTRSDRVGPSELAAARGRLAPVATPVRQEFYRLFRLSP